jgi:hypothetical protein
MILLRKENNAMPTADCWAIENYTYRRCPHPAREFAYAVSPHNHSDHSIETISVKQLLFVGCANREAEKSNRIKFFAHNFRSSAHNQTMNNNQLPRAFPVPCSLFPAFRGTPYPPSYIFKTLQIILITIESIGSKVDP